MGSETDSVGARLTEFASSASCNQAEVLSFLGREVTQLTADQLPTLQKISEMFTTANAPPAAQKELNHYITHIQKEEPLYPYWVEKLKHIPETEKEREGYLKEIFSSDTYEPIDTWERMNGVIKGLKSCEIKDQVLLAKIITYATSYNIIIVAKDLGIDNQDALKIVALAVAKLNAFEPIYFLKQFPACDEACQIEMAKIVLVDHPAMFLHFLPYTNIKNQDILDEFALLCSKKAPLYLIADLHLFGKLKKTVLKEVIKNIVMSDASSVPNVVNYLKRTENFESSDRTELGILCTKQKPDSVDSTSALARDDKVYLEKIATIAFNAGAQNVCNFLQILDLPVRIKLFHIAIRNSEDVWKEAELCFRNSMIYWKNLRSEVEIDLDSAYPAFKSLVASEFPDVSFTKEFGMIDAIKDPYAKEQSLNNLIEILGCIRLGLSEEGRKWILNQGFVATLLSIQNPPLRTQFLQQLLLVAENPESRGHFASLRYNKAFEQKYPWVLLTRVLYAGLMTRKQEGQEAQVTKEEIEAFRNVVEKGLFIEDKKKAAILIDALYRLNTSSVLSPTQITAFLQRIVRESTTNRTTFDNVYVARNILQIKADTSLLDALPLQQVLQNKFREIVPMGEVENFSTKFSEIFLSSRQPNAVLTYATKMKSLNDPKLMTCLGNYIEDVLNGKFPAIRYETENNPHLAHIEKEHPGFIEGWKINVKRELRADEAVSNTILSGTKEWLIMKLVHDNHLDLAKLPNLIEYVQATEESAAKERLQEKIEELSKTAANPWTTDAEFYQQLEIELLHLCQLEPSDLKGQVRVLQEIRQLLVAGGKLQNQQIPVFQTDIDGRIKEIKVTLNPNEQKKYIIVNTDDPIDLLNCGTESPGSCQRVDGNANLNKGLLGYLMDGKNRLLAVKDAKTGVIAARTMMKVLWDHSKNQPVILLERVYGNRAHVNALVSLAKRTARGLGNIPVVFVPEGLPAEPATKGEYGKIEALGGPAPFEYSDAAKGCQPNGKYTVAKAQLL